MVELDGRELIYFNRTFLSERTCLLRKHDIISSLKMLVPNVGNLIDRSSAAQQYSKCEARCCGKSFLSR